MTHLKGFGTSQLHLAALAKRKMTFFRTLAHAPNFFGTASKSHSEAYPYLSFVGMSS